MPEISAIENLCSQKKWAKVHQKIFTGCYPIRPPIMPNFIEIGQRGLEIMVGRKKNFLTQTHRHVTDRQTHGILTGWVAPRSMREARLKKQSKHKYENKRKTHSAACCAKNCEAFRQCRDIADILSPCTELQVKLLFLFFFLLQTHLLLRVWYAVFRRHVACIHFFSVLISQPFLPRDAMLSAVYAVVVCLCVWVCVSATLRYCIKTAKRRITQIMPHDSPETLVFWHQSSRRTSNGIIPYRGDKCRWGGLKLATFDKNVL